jgi:hypothetical protein
MGDLPKCPLREQPIAMSVPGGHQGAGLRGT